MKDFTRRDFIKTTGLAAGGLMISSGLLKAQGKKAGDKLCLSGCYQTYRAAFSVAYRQYNTYAASDGGCGGSCEGKGGKRTSRA